MGATFEAIPYKTMPGYYVRATWSNGRPQNIDDNSTDRPAFDTEADAQAWISENSTAWLKRFPMPS